MKHKHCELIKAWADGAEIQWKSRVDGQWRLFEGHIDAWIDDYEYRIKPEPKPDVVVYTRLAKGYGLNDVLLSVGKMNLKLTFDGETGELKSAEVLK